MRGKLPEAVAVAVAVGITPADAGKTVSRYIDSAVRQDHPRGCGENMYTTRTAPGFLGSPPRMRGKRFSEATESMEERITPADAGKTSIRASRNSKLRDHPRGCGENRCQRQSIVEYIGSPPRMRGKQSAAEFPPARYWDHPRGCGENLSALFLMTACTGSPPRMRGKPHRPKERGGTPGITPADAGKTIFVFSPCFPNKDHPRGCGENNKIFCNKSVQIGSPPRMRGKLTTTP